MTQPATRVYLLLGIGVVVIGAALAIARQVPTEPRDERSLLIVDGDTSRITMPDTVATGQPFEVTFNTFGGGCVRQPARTAVTMSLGTAVIQPYDHNHGGLSCPSDRLRLTHVARLRFDLPGRASIRIAAARRDNSSRPTKGAVELIRTVVVCDCRVVHDDAPPPSPTPVSNARVAHAPRTATGITYFIDTIPFDANAIPPGPDALREWAAFATFTARVTFAAGRGRMDILTRRGGPRVLVDSVAASPLAERGDYYLFDSTGVTLVRTASKTFIRYSISDDAYNYRGSRDGWPDFFEFVAPLIDSADAQSPTRTHASKDVHIFWHADALPNIAIARGRLTLDDAPMGELNVARWFGATRALARLADSTHALPSARVSLTAAIPRAPERKPGVFVSFLLKQEFSRLHMATVDLGALTPPSGFREERPSR